MENHIPHLITAQAGPFYELEKCILDNRLKIEAWFRDTWFEGPPILTSSVDLRNSGFKIAAIDTNLFPAGFNNLNPEFIPLCVQAAQSALYELYPHCKKILIIPENHTRNEHYYQSVATLSDIIQKAGYEVIIGSMLVDDVQQITLPSGLTITLHAIQRKNELLACGDFVPCLIILNNDLSEGIPEILQNIKQPIEPPPLLGWSNRSKAHHLKYYREICETFAHLIDIDPWQIFPLFYDCGEIDFIQKDGIECLVNKSYELIKQIQLKYNEYNIEHKPYIIIKADAGTYGMAVMSINDPEQLFNLNRKQRTTMSMRIGGMNVNNVVIHEGVYSFVTMGENLGVAVPVVDWIGQ
ncbi:MAG: glutamate--cysteine ligase, partial [Candidatus Berkiella sp.]